MSIVIELTNEQQLAIAAEYAKLDAMAEAKEPGMMIAQVFGNHMKVGVIDGQKARALQAAFGSEHVGKTVRTAYDDPANVQVDGTAGGLPPEDGEGGIPSPYCTCGGDDTADEEELFANRCKSCGGQLV